MVGALLGQCGLKRLSGRSMATLIIAANIPDIDAIATVMGTESLAMRRGITHGPIAMLLLPLALTGLMLAWDRWRPAAQPVRAGPLLLLAYIGTLSHPALDFLNSYGIRLLEPFSSQWVYGDTLFIIDVWIWAALIGGFLFSRWRERRERAWRPVAWTAFGLIAAYTAANAAITHRAESAATRLLTTIRVRPTEVVANPVPVQFWRRRMLWRTEAEHGDGHYDMAAPDLAVSTWLEPNRLDHPALAASRGRPDVEAFLFWSRTPFVAEVDGRAYLMDQRFSSSLTRGNFRVPLDSRPPAP